MRSCAFVLFVLLFSCISCSFIFSTAVVRCIKDVYIYNQRRRYEHLSAYTVTRGNLSSTQSQGFDYCMLGPFVVDREGHTAL